VRHIRKTRRVKKSRKTSRRSNNRRKSMKMRGGGCGCTGGDKNTDPLLRDNTPLGKGGQSGGGWTDTNIGASTLSQVPAHNTVPLGGQGYAGGDVSDHSSMIDSRQLPNPIFGGGRRRRRRGTKKYAKGTKNSVYGKQIPPRYSQSGGSGGGFMDTLNTLSSALIGHSANTNSAMSFGTVPGASLSSSLMSGNPILSASPADQITAFRMNSFNPPLV